MARGDRTTSSPRSSQSSSSSPSSHEHEVELKFAVVDPDAVRSLVDTDSVAGLQAGPWRAFQTVDRYLDTQSGLIAKAGYGVRLRKVDRRTLLTIKSAPAERPKKRKGAVRGSQTGGGRSQALHRRLELEGRATQRLDPSQWPDSAARSLVEATAGGEKLRTLFVIEQRREERDLSRADGSLIAKLSLDASDVRRFGRVLGSFATLEVESANPDDPRSDAALTLIGSALEDSGLLKPETRSKEQIGAEMLKAFASRGRAARPPKQPGITVEEPLGEAGRKVLRMHLLRMLEAEPGARAGDDIDGVHKMRVATRRMRAAWRVFDGAYRRSVQKRYVDQLREVAATLGAVRDLDVQLERLKAFGANATPETAEALAPLTEEWKHRRGAARAVLLDLLASRDYSNFVDSYRAFVDTAGAGVANVSIGRVRDVAAGRIWRAYETFRAHEAVLPWADVPALHAIRIDGKRLRYTLEFFREVLPAQVDLLIAEVVAVQDHLGLLNDAQVASDITRDWLISSAGSQTAEAQRAAGRYLESSEADLARLRRTFRPMWRRVGSEPFRRRLGATIASI